MAKRVGPQMQAAVDYVRATPGCTTHEVPVAIGPHRSGYYGWRAVQRAIDAGLIVRGDHPTRKGWAALHVAPNAEGAA